MRSQSAFAEVLEHNEATIKYYRVINFEVLVNRDVENEARSHALRENMAIFLLAR